MESPIAPFRLDSGGFNWDLGLLTHTEFISLVNYLELYKAVIVSDVTTDQKNQRNLKVQAPNLPIERITYNWRNGWIVTRSYWKKKK